MDTIAEAANEEPEVDLPGAADLAGEPAPSPSWWERFISADTGEGPLANYRDHAINFTGDEGGARIARGMTGLFDNLNLAVVDLVVGGIQVFVGLKKQAVAVVPNATGNP